MSPVPLEEPGKSAAQAQVVATLRAPGEHIVEMVGGGGRFRVRPVRATDESAVLRLLQNLSPEEIRLRFFCCMRYFSEALLYTLTHVDNVRQLGLVAIPVDGGADEIVASAMLVPESGGVAAEFAALVHHDYVHHGLGRHLIECLIEHAGMHDVHLVYGVVLRDNDSMLQLASEMGFLTRPNPGDRSSVRVELPISIRR